jgi:hypothetical protein
MSNLDMLSPVALSNSASSINDAAFFSFPSKKLSTYFLRSQPK